MTTLGTVADYVRSKNAGPFWLTLDIFCGSAARFDHVAYCLNNAAVAQLFDLPVHELKRFDIPSLGVIKLSVPRPTVQGVRTDRDMHGAAWAVLLASLPMPPMAEK